MKAVDSENWRGVEGHAAQRDQGEGADSPASQVIHSPLAGTGNSAKGGASQAMKPELRKPADKPEYQAGIESGRQFFESTEGKR